MWPSFGHFQLHGWYWPLDQIENLHHPNCHFKFHQNRSANLKVIRGQSEDYLVQ
jgi:hypothetical protein